MAAPHEPKPSDDKAKDHDEAPPPAPRASSSSTSPMRPTPPKGPTYKFAVDAKVRRTGFDSPLTVVQQQPTPDGHPQYTLHFWREDGDYESENRKFVALEDELQPWSDT